MRLLQQGRGKVMASPKLVPETASSSNADPARETAGHLRIHEAHLNPSSRRLAPSLRSRRGVAATHELARLSRYPSVHGWLLELCIHPWMSSHPMQTDRRITCAAGRPLHEGPPRLRRNFSGVHPRVGWSFSGVHGIFRGYRRVTALQDVVARALTRFQDDASQERLQEADVLSGPLALRLSGLSNASLLCPEHRHLRAS